MTYSILKPDSGPAPSIDVNQIQTNFSQFASIFSRTVLGINYGHTALNLPNQGDHESVIMQRQTSDPGVTSDYTVLYSKNSTSAAGTQPQLFAQIPKFLPTSLDPTDAPNNPMALTYQSVGTAGPVFYSFLPGGYLIYFGAASGTPATVTLSPAPTKILVALATPTTVLGSGGPRACATSILSATGFVIVGETGSTTFKWMAIAYA